MIPPNFQPPESEATRTAQAWLCGLALFLLGVLSATGVMVLQ